MKFLLHYFQRYSFVVANKRGNSLHQLIVISYPYNIKMDLFDQTEHGNSKRGCKYEKIQDQNSIVDLGNASKEIIIAISKKNPTSKILKHFMDEYTERLTLLNISVLLSSMF